VRRNSHSANACTTNWLLAGNQPGRSASPSISAATASVSVRPGRLTSRRSLVRTQHRPLTTSLQSRSFLARVARVSAGASPASSACLPIAAISRASTSARVAPARTARLIPCERFRSEAPASRVPARDRRGCVSGWPASPPPCPTQRCEHTFVPWLRCPNCADWSEPQHWERGTHPNDPHAVRCPWCGKWCDPSDQTMRIGERPDDDATELRRRCQAEGG
jgi:hypothetical protein